MTRIYVLFADEPVFHPSILRAIVHARRGEVVGVGGVRHRRPAQGLFRYLQAQFRFWGAKGLLLNASALLAGRVLDKLPFPATSKRAHSLASVCADEGIPFDEVRNVNDPALLDRLRGLDVDVIVSSQGQIFRRELLDLPRLACINRHSALLPAYGGMKPVFWAMLEGESEVGVSVHVMEEEIDRGRILAQIAVPISAGESLYALYRDVFHVSADAIIHAIEVLQGRATPPVIDASSVPTYFREPGPSDLRSFRMRGYRMA